MSFPVSYMFYLFISSIFKNKGMFLVFLTVIITFINLNIGYQFYEDQIIGKSIIMQMRENENTKNNSVFEIRVNDFQSGLMEKNLDRYPLFGHFYAAFGDEKRAGYFSNRGKNAMEILYQNRYKNFYKCSQVEVDSLEPQCRIYINVNDSFLGKKNIIKIFVYSFIDKDKYYSMLEKCVALSTEKI